MSSLRTLRLIFYRRDNKEGAEITETKYYFDCFLDLRLLGHPQQKLFTPQTLHRVCQRRFNGLETYCYQGDKYGCSP
ncbi:MAG: hypothetical protein JWR09_4310 [Mucilaginibacter sp.]|nr:hypothetical protein [Mucilaginibacter sp.]